MFFFFIRQEMFPTYKIKDVSCFKLGAVQQNKHHAVTLACISFLNSAFYNLQSATEVLMEPNLLPGNDSMKPIWD